jgi:hypothetical protein
VELEIHPEPDEAVRAAIAAALAELENEPDPLRSPWRSEFDGNPELTCES